MVALIQTVGLLVTLISAVYSQMPTDRDGVILHALEHLYLDNSGPGGFKSVVEPCGKYIEAAKNGAVDDTLGRQTAAQWIRTAFHDFVTANIKKGTGGLDASLAYELDRAENFGVAFNDSLFFFRVFVNDKISMADVIAVGLGVATATCGGIAVPIRGGRIDATEAGPFGVPEPETDIKTTLSEFAGSGFSREDTIGLTACGHSQGGVHHDEFPQIVSASAIGPNNKKGRVPFDDSVDKFDNNHVREYLDGTGLKGGPLVTTSNVTNRADLRLFLADKNATAKKLASSNDRFKSTCANLFARMVDTVPRNVRLTPAVDPNKPKYANLTLNVDWTGRLTLAGFIRYHETAQSGPAPASLPITVIDRKRRKSGNSVQAITDRKDNGNGIYGPAYRYPFTISFPGSSGLSGIEVGKTKLPLQDDLFLVTKLSSISPRVNIGNPNPVEYSINITAALRSNKAPPSVLAKLTYSVPIPGTQNVRIDDSTSLDLKKIGTAGPFALYSVIFKKKWDPTQIFSSGIELVDERSKAKAAFFRIFFLQLFF